MMAFKLRACAAAAFWLVAQPAFSAQGDQSQNGNGLVASPAANAANLIRQAAGKVAGWSWRGIADPLVLQNAVVFFGTDDKTNRPVARRLDWEAGGKITDTPITGLPLNKDLRYTAAANAAGIWLAGPTLALIQPGGALLQAPAGALRVNRPPMVALADGSAIIFKSLENDSEGKSSILRASVAPDGKSLVVKPVALLSYDGTPNQSGKTYRSPQYAHGAQLLADGRVLMFGDARTSKLASIFDPSTAKMTPVASMPHERAAAASTRLDDGRVVVAGSVSLRCTGIEARKVDVYDVQSNRWSSLPELPMPLCAEAYSAWQPSVVQASDGSLVLGGGLEPELLVLSRDPKGPLGFSSQWRRVGQIKVERTGGRLQALPGAWVAVIGGVHNPAGFGGCCERTPGIDVVDLKAHEAPFSPGGLTLNGPGVAQRGSKVFITGGRRFMTTSSGQMRYASHAELLDLKTGVRTQLPASPVVAGAADAFWIDDDRVIIKGISAKTDRGFEGDMASAMPDGSTKMAIFSFSANRWQLLSLEDDKTGLDGGRLLGVTRLAGRAEPVAVINAAAGPGWVPIKPGLPTKATAVPWPGQADNTGGVGTARLLDDGKLVLSGEMAASDLISVFDEQCEIQAAQPSAACPEEFAEMGLLKPAHALKVISLNNPQGQPLREMAPPPNGLVRNAVAPNGDVLRLVWEQPKDEEQAMKPGVAKGWALKRWRSGAQPAWETLPVPSHWSRSNEGLGAAQCGNGSPGNDLGSVRCQLIALDDPRDLDARTGSSKPLVFLRTTVANRDIAWNVMQSTEPHMITTIHWLDQTSKRWVEVLRMNAAESRATPKTITSLPGKPMLSLGWHLDRPLLWLP